MATWQRVFQIILLVVGCLFVGAVLVIAAARLGYRYELEWMEGGTLQTVQRLVAGLPIYVAPSLDFVPFIYTPLYFFLAAGLTRLMGDGFVPLRLISLLATIGSMSLIFLLIKKRTQSLFWGFMGAAFFAACFEIGGGWFDLARVDSLYLFFLLLAVHLLDIRPDKLGNALAGLAFLLAFLTKQSALVVLVPIVLWTVISGKGMLRWLMPAVTLGGISLSVLVLNFSSGGWFNFYVFQLPSSHEIAIPLIVEFWRFDLLAPLPFALVALFLLLLPTEAFADRKDRLWLFTLAVAFVGSSFFSRLHAGGWNNVLLPAYAMLAIILATTLGRFFRTATPSFKLLIYGICFLQFSLLIFDPGDHLPGSADSLAGDELVAKLEKAEAEIWMPHHGWLVAAAGGDPSAHSMAMQDVLRGGNQEIADTLDKEIRAAISTGYWDLIILDGESPFEEMSGKYGLVEPAVPDSSAFWTVTGLRTRPELVYRKNR